MLKNYFKIFREARSWGILVFIVAVYIAVSELLIPNYYVDLYPIRAAMSTQSATDMCRSLEYAADKCSSLLNSLWLTSKIFQSKLLVYAVMVLGIIMVFIATTMLTSSRLSSIMAALLYVFTPSVLNPVLLDYFGFIFITPLLLTSLVLIVKGLIESNKKLVVVVAALYAVLVVLHVAYWVVFLVITLYILVVYVRRKLLGLEKTALSALLVITAVRLVLGAFSYEFFLATFAILLALEVLLLDHMTSEQRTYFKAVSAILAFTLALSISVFISLLLMGIGLRDLYVRFEVRPVVAYGFAGFLALGGLLLSLRERVSDVVCFFIVALLVSTVLSLTTPILALLAVAFMSAHSGYLLEAIIVAIRAVKSQRISLLAQLLAVGVLIATLPASITVALEGRYAVNPIVENVLTSVDRERLVEIYEWVSNLGPEIVDAVLNASINKKILLVVNWDYSYWIYAELVERGLSVYTLSHSAGSIQSKSLIAKLFTASELSSKLVLKNITRDLGVEEVYVVVLCGFSVRRGDNVSFIGLPFTITGAEGPLLLFRAFGDVVLIPLYLRLAGREVGDYLFLLTDYGEDVQALMWTVRGRDMLLAKLAISAIRYLNYTTIYNYMTGYMPLEDSLTWYEPIYASRVYLSTIDTRYYGVYDLYLSLVVFRVKLD